MRRILRVGAHAGEASLLSECTLVHPRLMLRHHAWHPYHLITRLSCIAHPSSHGAGEILTIIAMG